MSISKGIVVCRSHIVNISNDGVYTMSDGCGVDFIFRYCNAEMATVEGVPVEEMLNRSFYKVFPNGDKKWLHLPQELQVHSPHQHYVFRQKFAPYLSVICVFFPELDSLYKYHTRHPLPLL